MPHLLEIFIFFFGLELGIMVVSPLNDAFFNRAMGNVGFWGCHAVKAPCLRFFDNQLIDLKALPLDEDLGAKVDLVQRQLF